MSKKKSHKSGRKKNKKGRIRYVEVAPQSNSMADSLKAILPDSASGQLLTGVLIGGALTYLMSDDKIRERIIRQGVQGFGNLAGTFAELKEQITDMQAEIEAGRASES